MAGEKSQPSCSIVQGDIESRKLRCVPNNSTRKFRVLSAYLEPATCQDLKGKWAESDNEQSITRGKFPLGGHVCNQAELPH